MRMVKCSFSESMSFSINSIHSKNDRYNYGRINNRYFSSSFAQNCKKSIYGKMEEGDACEYILWDTNDDFEVLGFDYCSDVWDLDGLKNAVKKFLEGYDYVIHYSGYKNGYAYVECEIMYRYGSRTSEFTF